MRALIPVCTSIAAFCVCHQRLMFGSDQMRWPEKIGAGIEAIEQAPFLTEEQKRDIFYHNAVRFLRLEQDRK